MLLRSGPPFWAYKNSLLASYPPLTRDFTCDVAIVGGGVTGALLAREIASAGFSCLLLDKRDVGWGSSMASTAMLQYEIDIRLTDLAKKIGESDARRAYRLCATGVEIIEDLTSRSHDRCDFQHCQSLFLARRGESLPAFRHEFESRQSMKLEVKLLSRSQLRSRWSIDRPAAIVSSIAARVDPYQLTHALLRAAVAQGLRVADRTKVVAFERPKPFHHVLRTDRGASVRARHVVVATGYEAQSMLKEKIVTLKRTYALVSEPMPAIPAWLRRHLVWESDDPYFYLRATSDHRLMMGGEDVRLHNANSRDTLLHSKVAALEKKFSALLPNIPMEPAYAWSGIFGETRDGLGYFGESPELPGIIFALGFGGNGTTFSAVFSKMIVPTLQGRAPHHARLFRFGR